jgi:hypothetical protein
MVVLFANSLKGVFGTVESVKGVTDLYAPFNLKIESINEDCINKPSGVVNRIYNYSFQGGYVKYLNLEPLDVRVRCLEEKYRS